MGKTKNVKQKFFKIVFPHEKGFKYDEIRYPAGEWQIRLKNLDDIKRAVEKADGIKITAYISDGEVMRLLLLIDAIRGVFPTKPLILDLPYLPYGRADRRFCEGDCNGLAVFARVLKSGAVGEVPDEVWTVDAHNSKAAQRYIWGLKDFSPLLLIQEVIKKIGKKDLTIVIPDEGASKKYNWTKSDRVEAFGDIPVVQAGKVRDPQTGKLTSFYCPKIETNKVLIVDDICDGGGTFLGLAEAILGDCRQENSAWQPDLYLYVTHGIFSQGLEKLNLYFKQIFTADTFQKEKK